MRTTYNRSQNDRNIAMKLALGIRMLFLHYKCRIINSFAISTFKFVANYVSKLWESSFEDFLFQNGMIGRIQSAWFWTLLGNMTFKVHVFNWSILWLIATLLGLKKSSFTKLSFLLGHWCFETWICWLHFLCNFYCRPKHHKKFATSQT